MNSRKNRFDKFLDRESPFAVALWYAFWFIVAIGVIRIIAYGCGIELTQHWYDAPARWLVSLFLS